MTAKRKITDENGVQVFPVTHTKAVLDDNGNSVEQRLQEQMDVINQKQLEVGAVPSDLAPTAGSTNWVTSGGVYNALKAEKIKYDNSQSRLAAENVQAALDEINRKTFVVDEGPLPVQYTEGYYISTSGGLISNSNWKASEFLNIDAVSAGDTFVWSGISKLLAACIAFYDEDGTLMHAFSATGASRTITIANDDTAIGAAKVRASFLKNGTPSLTHNGADVLNNNIHYITRGIQDIAEELDSLPDTILSEVESHSLNNSEFVQGSNDTSGNITASTKRCITLELYDVDKNTIIEVANNGQAHVMLTYDADGTYRGDTTGWVTADATYTFDAPHKVRFLVSWDGSIDRNIAPSQITAVFTFTTPSKLVEIIDNKIDAKVGKVSISDNDSFCRYNKKIKVYNPYKDHPSNQYKGQMHCHTTNSDGGLAPAAVVAKYVGYGYDFMTITDHNYITPNPSPESDIVWMGDSYEDTWNSAGHQHMNVWNCNEVINRVDVIRTSNTPSMLVNHYVKNGDSVLSYNHPEYPPVYASDGTLENLPNGISFVEIYNSTIQTLLGTVDSLPTIANYGDMVIYNGTRYINKSITKNSPNWQETTAEANPDGNLDRGFRIMLDSGKKVFCDAVDDFHRGDNMENRGWQMVFANSRTKQSIWNGLLMGSSYASTGVYLNDVSFIDGVFKLDIANGESAVTTFYGYNNEVLGTSNGSTAIYEVTGEEKYVRAMVEISGKKAWTQPIWVISVGKQYEF